MQNDSAHFTHRSQTSVGTYAVRMGSPDAVGG